MTIDPLKRARDQPSNEVAPADRHSGEGLASVRPRLARTLAESALRTADRQPDAMTTRTPLEPLPEADPPSAPKP